MKRRWGGFVTGDPKSNWKFIMENTSRAQADSWLNLKGLDIEKLSGQNAEFAAEISQAIAVANTLGPLFADIAGLLSAPFTWIAKRSERNRRREELNNLDDRILEDIGITRDQIDGIVDGTIQRQRHVTARVKLAVLNETGAVGIVSTPSDDLPLAA